VDLAALLETIDFLCSAGVHGIVLFGSTGEFVHFGTADRARALSLAVKRSRCPVYANVSHSTLDSAIALADEAASAGAEGVLLMPPVYFRYDQETIGEYYREFLGALHGILPAYLYNIPAFCSAITVETAAGLIAAGYSGIKDSSGDPEYFAGLMAACGGSGARLLTGSERLYGRFRRAGASGIVSGVAAAVPELLVGYENALCRGDEEASSRLGARVEEFVAWCEEFPAPMVIREAANLRGLRPRRWVRVCGTDWKSSAPGSRNGGAAYRVRYNPSDPRESACRKNPQSRAWQSGIFCRSETILQPLNCGT
jgi:dihydrodipicolinate synthase/N-acetylneuraminate lyase